MQKGQRVALSFLRYMNLGCHLQNYFLFSIMTNLSSRLCIHSEEFAEGDGEDEGLIGSFSEYLFYGI